MCRTFNNAVTSSNFLKPSYYFTMMPFCTVRSLQPDRFYYGKQNYFQTQSELQWKMNCSDSAGRSKELRGRPHEGYVYITTEMVKAEVHAWGDGSEI